MFYSFPTPAVFHFIYKPGDKLLNQGEFNRFNRDPETQESYTMKPREFY